MKHFHNFSAYTLTYGETGFTTEYTLLKLVIIVIEIWSSTRFCQVVECLKVSNYSSLSVRH